MARGLVRTFQHTTLFQDMTVLQNVLMGLHLHSQQRPGARAVQSATRFPRTKFDRCHEVLAFTGLRELADQLGEKPATWSSTHLWVSPWPLAVRPRLLMLDEPVTGMNIDESQRIMALIKTIRDRGTTILLVEHNMRAVMGTCERIVVLNFGQKLAEGTPPPSVATLT